MKLLVALVLAFSAVAAKSFIPKKVFDETYFDKDRYESIFGKDKEYNANEVDTFTKPDYYKYFYPGAEAYKKPFYPSFPAKYDDGFYDPKEKYDFDTFTKYYTSHPVLGQLTKYFPFGKDTTYDNFYYPVPKEVVELTKTSKDLKETVNTLVKYYYNLPDDVKATVNKKYDFDNVVKFLLQVYYDIPNVADDLTTYYDIPTAVVAELKTQYDLRKVIYNIVAKYYGFGSYERDYYGKKYFDVKSVVSTLIKVYYGVPKFEYDVENYYYNPEYFGQFVEGIVSKKYDGIVDSVEGTLERRSRLSDAEKEYYDQFFNFDEYLKFVVKGYYYAYTESAKTPFAASEYFKKGFFTLVSKIFKYKKNFNGDKYDYVNFDNFYPLDYYYNVLFGYKSPESFPYSTNYYPKSFSPYNKDYNNFYKYFYGKYNTPKEFNPSYYGDYATNNPSYSTYPKHSQDFAKYFFNNYPEQFKYVPGDYKNFEKTFGDYYGNEDTSKYYDYVKKTFDFGKYEPSYNYNYDFAKKPFDTTYNGKYDYDFFNKYKTGAYSDDSSRFNYGYPYYPTTGYEFGGFSKDATPKSYYPFTFNKENTYPFNVNKSFFDKYFANKDF